MPLFEKAEAFFLNEIFGFFILEFFNYMG